MRRLSLPPVVLVAFWAGVSALTSQQVPKSTSLLDLPKIHRYLDFGMYSEAATALEPAIKTDEFNGELRELYGVALQGLKRYDEAIYNFQLAFKLDNNLESLKYLLEDHLAKYAISSGNPDRISAFETAKLLLSSKVAASPSARADELIEAQRRAAGVIIGMLSPVGIWRSDGPWHYDEREFEIRRRTDDQFQLGEHLPEGTTKCKHYCLGLVFDKTRTKGGAEVSAKDDENPWEVRFSGSALNSDSACLFYFDYGLLLTEAGTKLLVVEQSRSYLSPDPILLPSITKIEQRLCTEAIRKGVFPNTERHILERVR